MPEGHSIKRLANVFNQAFVGHRCELSSPQGRFAAGAALLTGERMVSAETKGKHLFLGFSETDEGEADQWIHTHLGLYGAWRFTGDIPQASIGAPRVGDPEPGHAPLETVDAWPPAPKGLVRLRILTDDSVADLNGPNRCAVITTAQKQEVEDRLGPDPLMPAALSAAVRDDFVARIRKSGRPVGELVMDQSIGAGVGNIYRAEALFRAGISPFRRGNRVSELRLRELWEDLVLLMEKGVEEGAINTVKEEDARLLKGDPEAARWYVYHRVGRPCLRCGAPVRSTEFKGRNLYWCGRCQR